MANLANQMSFTNTFTQPNPVKYFDFVAEKFLSMLPHISMSLLKFYQAMKISLLSQGQ